MLLNFQKRDVDGEADEEKLLLLLQPLKLHLHLTVTVTVVHHEVLTTVVRRLLLLYHPDRDGRADTPERFLELVHQRHCHHAAVL